MCGEWFLVAPVYKDESVKEWSLYLPKGEWTDFFTGQKYEGGALLNGYDVSNYKMPGFVREGGIIPMYPESYYDADRMQQKPKNPLTLDIYPSQKEITKFELIEDDGITYEFKNNDMYNKTLIECDPITESNKVTIKVRGQYKGKGYQGMPETRDYLLQIHKENPKNVLFKSQNLIKKDNYKDLDKEIDGWYFDETKNILYIKIKTQSADNDFSVQVFY